MLNKARTGVFEWVLVKYIETFSFLVFLVKLSCPLQVYDERMSIMTEDRKKFLVLVEGSRKVQFVLHLSGPAASAMSFHWA